jgi:hypothetical protein
MVIYEPIDYFRISRTDLTILINEVLSLWPCQMELSGKVFGGFEEYKCDSFTAIYQAVSSDFDNHDFGEWSDLAPIVFDFSARAIKHASVYLSLVRPLDIDPTSVICALGAREDILIEA